MGTVRSAQIRKSREKFARRAYGATITEVSLCRGAGEKSQIWKVGAGVSVLAGGNGAGKSSLMRAIRACLDPSVDPSQEFVGWLSEVTAFSVSWSGTNDGISETFVSSLIVQRSGDAPVFKRSGTHPQNVVFIDAAAETARILASIASDPNFVDLLEGVDPAPSSPEDIDYASYILNRAYDSVGTYEITAQSEDDLPLPYLEVRALGAEYSVSSMGRGEFAALYLIWKLRQLQEASIVLLEEPEAHLATYSQDRLADVLLLMAHSRGLSFLVSTHSPLFFDSLPSGHVGLIRAMPLIELRGETSANVLAEELGLTRSAEGLAVTEDSFAASLLIELIRQLDRSLKSRIAVFYTQSGESAVTKVSEQLRPASSENFLLGMRTVIAVFDGDQKSKTPPTTEGKQLYLPGVLSPEEELKRILVEWYVGKRHFEEMPEHMAKPLREALESVDGLDHHDWMLGLARSFGNVEAFLKLVVPYLLQDETFLTDSESLMSGLRAQIGR